MAESFDFCIVSPLCAYPLVPGQKVSNTRGRASPAFSMVKNEIHKPVNIRRGSDNLRIVPFRRLFPKFYLLQNEKKYGMNTQITTNGGIYIFRFLRENHMVVRITYIK